MFDDVQSFDTNGLTWNITKYGVIIKLKKLKKKKSLDYSIV